jgi:hypothetical protein
MLSVPPAGSPALYSIRWGAIFAGVAVGSAIHLLLMVAGAAMGLALLEPHNAADALPIAAAVFNIAAMSIGALVGGYVAARASGLRRASDGMLHGLAAWGAATLFFLCIALAGIGALSGGVPDLASAVDLVRDAVTIPDASARVARAAALVAAAGAGLSLAMLLSLVAALLGGFSGTYGARRRLRNRRPTTPGQPV